MALVPDASASTRLLCLTHINVPIHYQLIIKSDVSKFTAASRGSPCDSTAFLLVTDQNSKIIDNKIPQKYYETKYISKYDVSHRNKSLRQFWASRRLDVSGWAWTGERRWCQTSWSEQSRSRQRRLPPSLRPPSCPMLSTSVMSWRHQGGLPLHFVLIPLQYLTSLGLRVDVTRKVCAAKWAAELYLQHSRQWRRPGYRWLPVITVCNHDVLLYFSLAYNVHFQLYNYSISIITGCNLLGVRRARSNTI